MIGAIVIVILVILAMTYLQKFRKVVFWIAGISAIAWTLFVATVLITEELNRRDALDRMTNINHTSPLAPVGGYKP